jgi:hypothetical protein
MFKPSPLRFHHLTFHKPQSNTVDLTIMAESSTDPIAMPAAEGEPNEAGAPVPSWGSGTAPSTPRVDDGEGGVSLMQGSIRKQREMLINVVQSDNDSAIDGMSAVFVPRSCRTTSSPLIL